MSNIFIVDDHPVARLAVRMLLNKEGNTVIGEADDGMQALSQLRHLTPVPDVVIIDLDIPSLSGMELIEKLRRSGYEGGILVLTARDDEHYQNRCMGIGADAFISKRNNLEELGDAMRAISRGYGYFPLKRLHKGANHLPEQEKEAIASLTMRELKVLQELVRGGRIVDIAQQMHLSTKTVSTYKRRMLSKLKLDVDPATNTTLALVDFGRRHKLDT
ncbi:response regulator [Pantoea sp. LS15]|uniref:response regulator n=1 Tax=Enterobacterales TaxID=91347 RepID=UPI000E0E94D4|nr:MULTISPECIES: response regulator [Enterobacterales]NJQ21788.1 response regulator [Pantoea sp. LS15]NKF48384.1 response regulator [Pantoea sp. LS15]RDK12942.1 response regulator [Enterobacter sp. 9-2]